MDSDIDFLAAGLWASHGSSVCEQTMNELEHEADAETLGVDDGNVKSKDSNTRQVNLSPRMVTHLGFHAHPITKPTRKATHKRLRNTIIYVETPTVEGFPKIPY